MVLRCVAMSLVLLMFAATVRAEEGRDPEVSEPKRLQIALLELEVTGGLDTTLARPISDRLRQELFKTGRFTVVERNTMEQIFEEQTLHLAGCMSDQCVVEVGRILGVEQMVAGSISRVGSVITVNARLIDVETTELTAAESVDCECSLETVLTISLGDLAALLADAVSPRTEEESLAQRADRSDDPLMPEWEWTESFHDWGAMTATWIERTGIMAMGFNFGWSLSPFQDPSFFGSIGNGMWIEFPALRSLGFVHPAVYLGGGGMGGGENGYEHLFSEGGITLRAYRFFLDDQADSGPYWGVQTALVGTHFEISVDENNPPTTVDPQHLTSDSGGDVRLGVFVGSRFDLNWDIGGRPLFTFLELRVESGSKFDQHPNPFVSLQTGLGWRMRPF
jgi:TolB-like protein